MRRMLAIAAVGIATLGSVAEILSFAMNNGSFFVQHGSELVAWLSPAPGEMKTDACEQETNLFAQKLCRDKEDRKLRTKP